MSNESNAVVVDGPKNVRIKSAKKGPGIKIGVFASKADADKVAVDLKAQGTEVVITDYEPTDILTYDEWKNANEAEAKKNAALKELTAKFTPEQIATLKEAAKAGLLPK
jgi:hypothetical protein